MNKITVETTVNKDIDAVWNSWTAPEHIMQWMHASDDWECPHAENDLAVGGKFLSRLAAKDGSVSFDLTGIYTEVEQHKTIAYTLDDGRTVSVTFAETPEGIHVVETFEMENQNPEALQRDGWQAILNNFKTHTESL